MDRVQLRADIFANGSGSRPGDPLRSARRAEAAAARSEQPGRAKSRQSPVRRLARCARGAENIGLVGLAATVKELDFSFF